jgi:glycosyltransferase involved in cell wall biosynthesis
LQCTNLGGMEQVAFSLFDQLQGKGYSFRIATPRPWGLGRERILRVDREATAFDYRGRFGWRSFRPFREQARRLAAKTGSVWVIGACASCLAAAASTGRRVLLSHHYHHFETALSRVKWMGFYLMFGRSLDVVTFPTEFTRNEALQVAPWLRSKFQVVRNGFRVCYETEERRLRRKREARARLQLPQDAFVVGNAGWLIQRKRFDVFLTTARRVAGRIPNARFVICGGGPQEGQLKAQAASLGIADRVRFEGWVEDVSVYYQAWDALLFNSDFDTLPCAPMEAASHGCVCVASCLYGGLSEFLEHGRTGALLSRHEPEALAESLVRIARDGAHAARLRKRAVARLREEFGADAAFRFYEAYFGRE